MNSGQSDNKPSDVFIFEQITKIGQNSEGAFDITEENEGCFKNLIHWHIITPQEIVDFRKLKIDMERRTVVTQKLVDLMRCLDKSIDTLAVLAQAQKYLDSVDYNLDQSRVLGYVTPEQIQRHGVEYGMEHMRTKEHMIFSEDLRTGAISKHEPQAQKHYPAELKSNPLLDSQ